MGCQLARVALALSTLLAVISTGASAAAYDFGSLPNGASADVNGWKSQYVRDCGGGQQRVDDGQGNTLSEGMGYGMLIAAASGDEALFSGLWQYYKARRNSRGFMHWKFSGCDMTPAEQNGASDGDLDTAMALVMAAQVFPGKGYGQDAGWQIEALRLHDFDDCDGRTVLRPGDSSGFGGCDCANPSYFSPGYYRVFAKFTPLQAAFWNKAADDTYEVLADNQHPQSGLVTAWSTATGETASCDVAVSGGGSPGDYQYDAARTPFRIGIDFAWHGTPAAQAFLSKMMGWVKSSAGLPNDVGDGYTKAGQKRSNNKNSVFMGGFASGSVISAGDSGTIAGAWLSGPYLNGDGAYYSKSLQVLYSLFLSDKLIEPTVTCTPAACGARVCGTDGCGGSCGSCENGETCNSAGACGCEAPELTCGTQCADVRSDKDNCGGCGMVCEQGLICAGRQCTGTCKVLGTRDCGAGCIDILSDPLNCGGCGKICEAGLGCLNAECTDEDGAVVAPPMPTGPVVGDPEPVCMGDDCTSACAEGRTQCGDFCIDTVNDGANCGACGNVCAMNEACLGGACGAVCASGYSQCGSVCSLLDADVENCGSCGNLCGAGQNCVSGACTVAGGTSPTGGSVDSDEELEDGSSGCGMTSDSTGSPLGLLFVLALLAYARRRSEVAHS